MRILRNSVVALALLAAAVTVVVLVWSLTPYGRKDSCLDGGGRWLDTGICEGGLHDGDDLKLRF